MLILDEMFQWPGSRDELRLLLRVLVANCGCGCTADDLDFTSASPTCSAAAVLRDRRFLAGLVFARGLADRLRAEERTARSRAWKQAAQM